MPREIVDPQLSTHQTSVLVGTLLGDAALTKGKTGRYAHMSLTHGEKQQSYLEWKVDQLRPLFKDTVKYYRKVQPNRNNAVQLSVNSRSWPMLQVYRELLYPDGKKRFTSAMLQQVDDVALSVWFCDDGTLMANNHRESHKNVRNALAMYLGGVTQEEVTLVSTWFFDRNLNHTLTQKSQSCWSMYFKVDDAVVLKDRIINHVPDCMRYKLENVRI